MLGVVSDIVRIIVSGVDTSIVHGILDVVKCILVFSRVLSMHVHGVVLLCN